MFQNAGNLFNHLSSPVSKSKNGIKIIRRETVIFVRMVSTKKNVYLLYKSHINNTVKVKKFYKCYSVG